MGHLETEGMGLMIEQAKNFTLDLLWREIHDGWAYDNPACFDAILARATEQGAITASERQQLLSEYARWGKSCL